MCIFKVRVQPTQKKLRKSTEFLLLLGYSNLKIFPYKFTRNFEATRQKE